MKDYKRAFKIACELLSGNFLYGVDAGKIYSMMMAKDGMVSNEFYENYILEHLQELDQGQYMTSESEVQCEDALSCKQAIEILKDMISEAVPNAAKLQRARNEALKMAISCLKDTYDENVTTVVLDHESNIDNMAVHYTTGRSADNKEVLVRPFSKDGQIHIKNRDDFRTLIESIERDLVLINLKKTQEEISGGTIIESSDPTIREVMRHYGFDPEKSSGSGEVHCAPFREGAWEKFSHTHEFDEWADPKKEVRITFCYDADYPRAYIRVEGLKSHEPT